MGDNCPVESCESAGPTALDECEVWIRAPEVTLPGRLAVPGGATGIVLFAHGSGSSRNSPRNLAVAAYLRELGLATLLFDLLNIEEGSDRAAVFDIPLLGSRLAAATRWLDGTHPELAALPVGFFGASTGAAAALVAAVITSDRVAAVVSRGGRPDLAGDHLPRVASPTLLIVGGRDPTVLDLNRSAGALLQCPSALEIIPGATHLFEEPGALERAADLAGAWFLRWMGPE
jgi:putative phosphoribosyl transferase